MSKCSLICTELSTSWRVRVCSLKLHGTEGLMALAGLVPAQSFM